MTAILNFYREDYKLTNNLIKQMRWAIRYHPDLRETASECLHELLKDLEHIKREGDRWKTARQ